MPYPKWKLVIHLLKTTLNSAFLSCIKSHLNSADLLFMLFIVTLNSTIENEKSSIHSIL